METLNALVKAAYAGDNGAWQALHDFLLERGWHIPSCLKKESATERDCYVVLANFAYKPERKMAARAMRLWYRIKKAKAYADKNCFKEKLELIKLRDKLLH